MELKTLRFSILLLLTLGALGSTAPSFACSDPNGNCAELHDDEVCAARLLVTGDADRMAPGEVKTVVVPVRNRGTTTWQTGLHRLGSREPINNTVWADARGDLPFNTSVAPGEIGYFTLDLVAPSTPGYYESKWQMLQVNQPNPAIWFGETIDLGPIQVSDPADPQIPAGHYTVVVAAGQSNMTGAGTDAAELPDSCSDFQIINTYWNSNVSDDRWSRVKANGARFGADWPFARGLAQLRKGALHDTGIEGPIAIIKYSRGGSNLHTDWEKGNTNGYGLYDDMVAYVQARLTELGPGPDVTYEMGPFLWIQGEGDTASTESYETNLTNLFNNVQADLGIDTFLLSRLARDVDGHQGVRTGQVNVANTLAGAEWVDTDDLAMPDGIHFDSESQEIIGLRMAVAYLFNQLP